MSDTAIEMIALAAELEEFVLQVVPESSTVKKYGGTLFTLHPDEKEGQFCGVFVLKKHVQISFSKGATLDDPLKLLSGTGKLRRHTNYISPKEINFPELEKLLLAAAK